MFCSWDFQRNLRIPPGLKYFKNPCCQIWQISCMHVVLKNDEDQDVSWAETWDQKKASALDNTCANDSARRMGKFFSTIFRSK